MVGDKDSRKRNGSRSFLDSCKEKREKVAVLTKEDNFGARMIQDDTELLWIDEWKNEMISDDLLKVASLHKRLSTLLQGCKTCKMGFMLPVITYRTMEPSSQHGTATVHLRH